MKKMLLGLLLLNSISAFALPFITELDCSDGDYRLIVKYYGDLKASTALLYENNKLVFNTHNYHPITQSENHSNSTKDFQTLRFEYKSKRSVSHIDANIDIQNSIAMVDVLIMQNINGIKANYSNESLQCSATQVEMHY